LDDCRYHGTSISAHEFSASAITSLGMFCNKQKKFDRGDYGDKPLLYKAEAIHFLKSAANSIDGLIKSLDVDNVRVEVIPHPTGVDLAAATTNKFNEVSERVGSTVFIANDSVIRDLPYPIQED
jgi:hypothetical protein